MIRRIAPESYTLKLSSRVYSDWMLGGDDDGDGMDVNVKEESADDGAF